MAISSIGLFAPCAGVENCSPNQKDSPGAATPNSAPARAPESNSTTALNNASKKFKDCDVVDMPGRMTKLSCDNESAAKPERSGSRN